MLMGVQLLTHTTKIGLKSLLEYFHTSTMSVAPLAISFFFAHYFCSLLTLCSSVGGGRGRVKVVSESTKSVTHYF